MLSVFKNIYSKPTFVTAIAMIYFFLVVSTHEVVGEIVVAIFRNSSRVFYQATILVLGISFMLIYVFFTLRKAIESKYKKLIYWQLFITLLLAIASFELLIIHNIEIIHFLQYAIMAILIFPLTKTLIGSIYWASLLGIIDEGYQYFILAPEKNQYFDFNDIILNTIGAAFGAIFVLVHLLEIKNPFYKKWYKSDVFLSFLLILLVAGLLFAFSIVQVYGENGQGKPLVLIKNIEAGFWTHIDHLDVKYHIIRPFEGVLIALLLLLLYGYFNYLAYKKNSYERS
jgi:VanZ family protein